VTPGRRCTGLLLAALLAGCATLPPPTPQAVARARAAQSYSGRVRVSLRARDFRARTPVLIALARPDMLRVEVPGPAGARLVTVAGGGQLVAVFPAERAVFRGAASALDLEALLGVALTPAEVLDLLLGQPPPRLARYEARWKDGLPIRVEATLPDGARLTATVEEAELDPVLPEGVFAEPMHQGYRSVDAEEARSLWR
jgi:hypothetical protein